MEFIKNYYEPGIEPVAGVIEKVKTEPQESLINKDKGGGKEEFKIKYEGLAVFKEDKFIGYLDGTQTRAYNFIINQFGSAFMDIGKEDSKTVFEIMGSKCETKVSFQNNKASVSINLKLKCTIVNEQDKKNIDNDKTLNTLQTELNKTIKNELTETVQYVQTKYNSDIFGFGKSLHKQQPSQWKKIKNNWYDYFNKADIKITVTSNITRSGEINQPAKLVGEPDED
ncbi:MAG: hypothetical protein BGN88_01980 [Clostridiales bacterium 43-6]|nr:MAG: hypothetical protein BGN88_01980 [Clostridiales bacterium 43-6]